MVVGSEQLGATEGRASEGYKRDVHQRGRGCKAQPQGSFLAIHAKRLTLGLWMQFYVAEFGSALGD